MTTFKALQKLSRCLAGVLAALVVLGVLCAFSVTAAHAETETLSPWWHLSTLSRPTYLRPGQQDAQMVVTAVNLGDAAADPKAQPITLTDKLPIGLKAVQIEAYGVEVFGDQGLYPLECYLASTSCVFTGKNNGRALFIPPYTKIQMHILVDVEPDAKSEELDEVSVAGGGAAPVAVTQPITVSDSPVPFGVHTYELRAEGPDGETDTQAGSHPFQFTTTLGFNEDFKAFEYPGEALGQAGRYTTVPAMAKDLHFDLPPGLVGNPSPFAQCPLAVFLHNNDECPQQSVVGIAQPTVVVPGFGSGQAIPDTDILYNITPAVGEPARFGFVALQRVPVLLTTAVRTGGDYGVTVNVVNISQDAEFLGSEVTFWGVPGDPRHNAQRGSLCFHNTLAEVFGGVINHVCQALDEPHPPPLLSLPTSCPANPATGLPEPLHTTLGFDSWKEPQNVLSISNTAPMPALDGCNRLQFAPEIKVTPDGSEASKPTGLNVDVHVPQEGQLNGEGLGQSGVRNITVKLPAGVAINPSSGDGLGACSADTGAAPGAGQLGDPGDQIGFGALEEGKLREFTEYLPGIRTPRFTPYLPGSIDALANGFTEALQPGQNFCANASKIAEVTIKTPLLPNPLTGFVYLAAQEANPFSSVIAMYLVAEDPVSGSLVKLPGEVQLCQGAGEKIAGMTCEALGQIVTTFEDNPQLPFEDAELHFFGGERAPLASPSRCGAYTTQASFAPWSTRPGGTPSSEAVSASSTFDVTSGPNGRSCPGVSLPFSPSLTGGALNVNAGDFSPFTATMTRLSGEQNLQSLEVHLPPGLAGILTGVELCPEPQANLGECGPNSLIGETTVGVGVGGEPYSVSGGKFFLTGPYNGTGGCTVGTSGCAPFGITFEVPAKAGPFDFAKTQQNHPPCDCVLVRGKIEINPETAAVTIISNPPGAPDSIPTSIEGIPLEIQHVNATTTRSNFQFNPTNCSKMEVTGTIHSSENSTVTIGVPFQVTNCAVLGFAPKFNVSTSAKTSRVDGASLNVKLTYPSAPFGSQANIRQVKVELPKGLPSRLQTLQKACTAAQFHANPAGCPAASIVGHAKAVTPLVPVPLEGPAYFVSNGGEAFPNLVVVLQGYGVTIELVGDTFISKAGVTSSTFKTVPDAPVGSFELNLPEGPYSVLTTDGSLCKQKLVMPSEFVAQNGAKITQSTKIAVTGCPRQAKKAKKARKHSSHRRRRKVKAKAGVERGRRNEGRRG